MLKFNGNGDVCTDQNHQQNWSGMCCNRPGPFRKCEHHECVQLLIAQYFDVLRSMPTPMMDILSNCCDCKSLRWLVLIIFCLREFSFVMITNRKWWALFILDFYSYSSCSKCPPWASAHFRVRWTTVRATFAKVSSAIAAHAVSIYSRSAASIAGFLRYTTFLRVPHR